MSYIEAMIQYRDNLLKEIKQESETKLLKGDACEMTDIIFDTLFGNEQFPQFDKEKLTPIDDLGSTQACDGKKTIYSFWILWI